MVASPMQILVVVVLLILLFGAGRLGDVGKGLGAGIRNFKKGLREDPKGDASDSDPSEDGDPKQLKGKKKAKTAEVHEVVAEKKEKQ